MRSHLVLLMLGLAACDGTGDDKDTPPDDTGEPHLTDADGDGYYAEEDDCDDSDASAYPSAEEVCDGVDNSCDGNIDEGVTSTYYRDADGDGFGDDGETREGCTPEEGWVESGGDCDDADPAFNPVADESDCTDPADYNCDGSVGYRDEDGDGHAACEDCDDADANINPSGTEVCDGVDNDCDATIDEPDAADASTFYADADNDGYGDANVSQAACEAPIGYTADASDCDDSNASISPAAAEVCDGIDNDCDNLVDDADSSLDLSTASTWYADSDTDGYGDPNASNLSCAAPSGHVSDSSDCDDSDGAINPAATEVCDGVDDDCDAVVDNPDTLLGSDPVCAGYSCLEIVSTRTNSPGDGVYYIDPNADGNAEAVWCDMTTDGGGYTMLKVSPGYDSYGTDAESYCAGLGMQLFIPRTQAHKDAALAVARSGSIGPDASDNYMRILGIYPNYRGANCVRVGFNSGSCTVWHASDNGPYFVGTNTGITEPNGDNDTTASMYYAWNSDGSVNWYNDIYSPGYTSSRFMCDVGDKQ